MGLIPDGVQAAADREDDFHPVRLWPDGKERPITAWQRRAKTIQALVDKVNELEKKVAELEAQPSNPFPFRASS